MRLVAPKATMLGVGILLALAGCSAPRAAEAAGDPTPAPVPTARSAADAGGACVLWDYPFLEEQLGVRFDVAAAGQAGNMSTCVAQVVGADRPDLSLSVLEGTDADPAMFTSHLVPADAVTVEGLGRAGYRLTTAAGRDRGPVVEVGWLSVGKQVQTLRFTFAVGATSTDAAAMATRLVSLARTLESAAS